MEDVAINLELNLRRNSMSAINTDPLFMISFIAKKSPSVRPLSFILSFNWQMWNHLESSLAKKKLVSTAGEE